MNNIVVFQEDLDSIKDTTGNFCCSSRSLSDIHVKSIQFSGENNEFFDIRYMKEKECHYRIPWNDKKLVALILDHDHESGSVPDLNSEDTTLYGMLKIVFIYVDIYVYNEILQITSPSGAVLYEWKGGGSSRNSIETFCHSRDNRYVGIVVNWEDGDQREDPGILILDLSKLLPRWYKSDLEIALPFLLVQQLVRRLGQDEVGADAGLSDMQLLHAVLVDQLFLFQYILSYLCGEGPLLLKKYKSRRGRS